MKVNSIYSILRRFIIFFLLTALIVSSCFVLFLKILQETLNYNFSESEISKAASLTFYNVVFITLLITVIDEVFYYVKTILPMKQILSFTEKLSQGEFDLRLEEKKSFYKTEYDVIIHNLNLLATELGSIEGLRSDFINNISHEIKTPLSIIQNYTQLMLAEDGKNEEYLKAVYSSTTRLTGLVQDILRLSRLEKQKIFATKEVFCLSDSLADAIVSFEEKWEAKNINIIADIEENVYLKNDKELLNIIWNNFLSNAIKFTPNGGSIEITLKELDGRITVAFKDSGSGISEKDIRHIFDKFYQGETDKKKEGNGLGLALVKQIAVITGADLKVNSKIGEGSCFSVSFLTKLQ